MYFCPRHLPKMKGAPEGSCRELITLERLLDYITRYRLEVEVMWQSIGAVYWIGGRSELPAGWRYTTERLNLSIRQHVAAVGRRVTTLCKGEDGLHQQLALYHIYYNFCLPHAS